MTTPIIIWLSVYIALLLLASFIISKKQDEEQFLIAGRDRTLWQILLSKFAASAGAAFFITYTGFAYKYGSGVFAILGGTIIGYLIFALWAAPRIAQNSKKERFYTIGHFVKDNLSSEKERIITDFLSSAVLFLWLVVGTIGGGKIISEFGLLSYNVSVIITSSVVLGYLLLAGYYAVLITDIIQSIIIILLTILLTFNIAGTSAFSNLSALLYSKINIGTVLGFFLYGVLSVFSFADRYQLCYAAKTKKDLKLGLALPLAPILLMAYFLFLIGIYMAEKETNLDEALVFIYALKHFLTPVFLPLAIILFFAGIMSSADTQIYAIASHYVLSKKSSSPNKTAKVKKTAFFLVILLTLVAILFPNIIKVSILAAVMSVVPSFPMIYIISGGKSCNKFLASVLTSLAGMILGVLLAGITPSALVFVVLLGPVGLLYKDGK